MTAAPRLSSPSPRGHRPVTPWWVGVVAAAVAPWALASYVSTQEPGPRGDPATPLAAPAPPPETLTREARDTFLRGARIIRSRAAPGGVTGSRRVTLSDGILTHDAHVQSIDESRTTFQGRRSVELNFRDSWRYNVAAYRLGLLLGLDMIPVTVERPYQRDRASFTWWVDDVMMDEATRLKEKRRAPDVRVWNQQMAVVRVFDQLIYNTDRNLGNLLITSDWQLWMIDHTRAFRLHRTLRAPVGLSGCDRRLLAGLAALDKAAVHRELSPWLEPGEIDALLSRRDAILQFFKAASPTSLFDLPGRHLVAPPDAAALAPRPPTGVAMAVRWPFAAAGSGPHWR